jgi:hypothetical protein
MSPLSHLSHRHASNSPFLSHHQLAPITRPFPQTKPNSTRHVTTQKMPPRWFLSDLEDRKKRRDKDSTDRTASSCTAHTPTTQQANTSTKTQTDASGSHHKKVDSGHTCVGDGKSKDCDLTRTFSAFLDRANIPDRDDTEQPGRGQRAWTAVKTMLAKK